MYKGSAPVISPLMISDLPIVLRSPSNLAQMYLKAAFGELDLGLRMVLHQRVDLTWDPLILPCDG
jgi:hypothetical protein